MERKIKKSRLMVIIQAFLISFACTVQFHKPLIREEYEEWIDYALAQAAELLGTYDFISVLVFVLAGFFLWYVKPSQKLRNCPSWIFSGFLSACLFLGRSYKETNSWTYCFGSAVNLGKFLLALAGMTILLRFMIGFFLEIYEKCSASEWQMRWTGWLFGKKCFWKIFVLLLLVWTPVIVVSYPGNVCYDVIGQIEQGIGLTAYSAHHPLLHTILVGGLVKLGWGLTGSYDAGLFLYIWVQALMLSSALAGTIWWLSLKKFAKGKISHPILLLILGVYIFSPMYSNMVSTAIKDIPFMAAFVWYMILLAEIWHCRERLKNPLFVAAFLVTAVAMSLLRNNGFYVLVLTGVIMVCAWWRGAQNSARLKYVLYLLIVPVVLSKMISGMLLAGLDAQKGKAAEMFSLPFQQTARYMQLYRGEISEDEKQAIEGVLGDVEQIAISYDPDIADPVKRLYYEQSDVTGGELVEYFLAWAKGFFKHPGVYFEAFFAHVYGWFDPQVSNAPRYEAEYTLFEKHGLFTGADKVLLFIYRLADRVTPLGLLQNVGAYTWAMLILCGYSMRRNKRMFVLLVPLLVSLLICMASPCFYLHPRYAYPYMFTLPFLYGLAERSRE